MVKKGSLIELPNATFPISTDIGMLVSNSRLNSTLLVNIFQMPRRVRQHSVQEHCSKFGLQLT